MSVLLVDLLAELQGASFVSHSVMALLYQALPEKKQSYEPGDAYLEGADQMVGQERLP